MFAGVSASNGRSSARAGLVIQHEAVAPAALLGDWLDSQGIPFEVVRADAGELGGVDPAGRAFVVVLGSGRAADDPTVPWLEDELQMVRVAAGADVPVLGICFGGQLVARALGGSVARAPRPEIGWGFVQSWSAEVPTGPWAQWHYDHFDPPPGAEVLARSEVSCQAFRLGRTLGLQFHPECPPEVFEWWIEETGEERLASLGLTAEGLRSEAAQHAPAAREAALQLFATFFAPVRGVSARAASSG
jgi:GMP synthase (glutamine-hydrolysing)